MVRLRITYARASELRRDADQIAKGNLLVAVDAAGEAQFRDPVELEIVGPGGSVVRLEGEVLNVLPGHGIAVGLPAGREGEVRALVGAATSDAPNSVGAVHERVGAEPATAPAAEAPPAGGSAGLAGATRAAEVSKGAQIQTALRGSRDERGAILRSRNVALHSYVLKNPQITIDEITAIAKNPQMTPEMLRLVSERKEWLSRPEVALALARNPKTPGDIAVRALAFCPMEGLRQMAKGIGAPPNVVQAARKKLIQP